MGNYRLAFLGFGNVGKALARLLLSKEEELSQRYQITFTVTGIATGRHGMAIDPAGLDLSKILESEDLKPFSTMPERAGSLGFLHSCQADALFENTPVDYAAGQPAVDHLRTALELGMHAITANKGPVVHAYRELTDLAAAKGKRFFFESTVMDGAPIFSLFREALPGARLLAFKGVLNSTTNLILTRMEGGESFEEAIAYSRRIGIAETDPSGDIDGWDAAVKVAALVTVLMDQPLLPSEVMRTGIRGISQTDISNAKNDGKRWKLVCSAERTEDGVNAKVAPEIVGPESQLYSIEGTTSIVQFQTDVLGELSVVEANPGPHTTAYGLLADFVNAVKPIKSGDPSWKLRPVPGRQIS
jgi:homoserine dehydrogenase